MALPEYRIGSERFLWIGGPMDTTHARSEVIVRAGLPGAEIWRPPLQPVPFVLQTLVDAQNETHAYRIYDVYRKLPYKDVLTEVVIRDVNSMVMLTKYYIQDVRVVGVDQTLIHCGKAINPPSRALLRCEWLMVPFDVVPPPTPATSPIQSPS